MTVTDEGRRLIAPPHFHEWERGIHMAEAFGVDGRTYACAICGTPKPRGEEPTDGRD